jgi:chromosome partitioning protein
VKGSSPAVSVPMERSGAPVVACYALKGGVGKTSAAVNLAWQAAASGLRTLLWDLDPQAAASFLLRAKPKIKGGARNLLQGASDPHDAVRTTAYPNLDVLPAEVLYDSADIDLDAAKKSGRRVERALDALRADYALVVIDAPPGLSLLSANIVHAADLMLVPIVPSPLSLRTLDQVVEFLDTVDHKPPKVMAFLSMVDRRRALHRDVTERLTDRYGDVAKTVIPSSATIERMGQRRAPLGVWAARTGAAAAYRELWAEVSPRLGLPG